mgnify:CR=1 FL=1
MLFSVPFSLYYAISLYYALYYSLYYAIFTVLQSMTPSVPLFSTKKLWKSGTLWEQKVHFWTIFGHFFCTVLNNNLKKQRNNHHAKFALQITIRYSDSELCRKNVSTLFKLRKNIKTQFETKHYGAHFVKNIDLPFQFQN